MCRHCDARDELFDRIKDGQIGDIISLRAYRMHGPAVGLHQEAGENGITPRSSATPRSR